MRRVPVLFLLLGIFFTCADALPSAKSASEPGSAQSVQNGVYTLNTQFSKLLFKATSKPGENVLFSPFNIYTALATLHLGATGATRDELTASLLGVAADDRSSELHERLGKILDTVQHTRTANVSVGNGVFPQKGLKIKDSYREASKKYYNSEPMPVDFAQGGNEATDIVNKWISDKTDHRIPKLFQGPISATTRLLLASTLYFSATWENKFSETATKSEKFNTGVNQVDVQMMNAKKTIPYANNAALNFEAISIPYLKQEFSMLILLPYANRSLATLLDTLTAEHYRQLIADISAKRAYVDYKIPRLKFAWSRNINANIKQLGAKKIFENAQLGNLVDSDVAVSDVTHAAEIEIDEDGTVATAVTVIQFVKSSLQITNFDEPIKFYVNRPFVTLIYHRDTGVILFTGLVQNPVIDA